MMFPTVHSLPGTIKRRYNYKNTCLLWFHPAVCEKHETVKTMSANAKSLFITLPAPDDLANSNKSVHLKLCSRSKFQPGDCS